MEICLIFAEVSIYISETMKHTIVGIAELAVSNDPEEVLATYSLGSCIGLAIYDHHAKVGGMLHFMLPTAKLDLHRAKKRPAMFADTGVALLFKKAFQLGLRKERTRVAVAGAASILDESGYFHIGERNLKALIEIFSKNGIKIHAQSVGGHVNRSLFLEIATGRTWIKISGEGEHPL
jgi:chemotaxis protein CheD